MRDVHAIADDKHVGADEADEIGLDRHLPLALLLQQRANQHPPRAARHQQVLGESQRAARFENVVDEDDVAALHRRIRCREESVTVPEETVPSR